MPPANSRTDSDRVARRGLQLGQEVCCLGGPEVLGSLADRAELHLDRHEGLLGARVKVVLQRSPRGVGGGEDTLA